MPYLNGSEDTASVWKEGERLRDLVCELGFINQFSAPEILFSLSVSLFTADSARVQRMSKNNNFIKIRRRSRPRAADAGATLESVGEVASQQRAAPNSPSAKVFPVAMAEGSHLFPSRTQKLSLPAPMVLPWRRGGRVGHCRVFIQSPS